MATSPSSGTSVVVDASAALRALVAQQTDAVQWLDRVAAGELMPAWPAHFYVEVAQALVRLVRSHLLERDRAEDVFAGIRMIHPRVRGADRMEEAIALALERGLSVYDAAYVVLAEGLNAPLLTADRRLANATEQAVLLSG